MVGPFCRQEQRGRGGSVGIPLDALRLRDAVCPVRLFAELETRLDAYDLCRVHLYGLGLSRMALCHRFNRRYRRRRMFVAVWPVPGGQDIGSTTGPWASADRSRLDVRSLPEVPGIKEVDDSIWL